MDTLGDVLSLKQFDPEQFMDTKCEQESLGFNPLINISTMLSEKLTERLFKIILTSPTFWLVLGRLLYTIHDRKVYNL